MKANSPGSGERGRGLVFSVDGGRSLSLAVARYLGATYQGFFALAEHLAAALAEPFGQVAAAVRDCFGRNPRGTLGCFASPVVGSAIHCAPLGTTHPDFQAR